IENRTTVFQDATNDSSLKAETGRTKFPDILLFTDKISGIVFNGWELKFPDTPVDDREMLENALEKARRLQSDSFVTWNGMEAVIWGVDKDHYSIDTLTCIKQYSKIEGINCREDMADRVCYLKHEARLKLQLKEILHDLEQLMHDGHLRPALNISGNVIDCVRKVAQIIIPQFREAIIDAKSDNADFKEAYNEWRTYESATLKILEKSSRKAEKVDADEVLAKFAFYNLTGKILFYLTLCENYSGELEKPVCTGPDVKACLNAYFDRAKAIDFQAIFKPYFTDELEYSTTVNETLAELLARLMEFDFHILPPQVTGNILENLVPKDEKQKFGQYFTPEILADLVAYPAVRTRRSMLMDPTSGTGTFLNSFYRILKYDKHQTSHSAILE
ncbi:MAG: N-6 DNA methylase, partial [Paramuribaculum sp.]|nr:N-6 DNA methylase [Paramuribaculum sp.]